MLPFTRTVLEEEIRAAEHWHRMDESFHKLILTGDGVWQSKKFSKNGSYIVNDYELDGALLAYAHACQKGECDGDTEVHWRWQVLQQHHRQGCEGHREEGGEGGEGRGQGGRRSGRGGAGAGCGAWSSSGRRC